MAPPYVLRGPNDPDPDARRVDPTRRFWRPWRRSPADAMQRAFDDQTYADRCRYGLWPRLAELRPVLRAPRGAIRFLPPPTFGSTDG